MAQELVQAQEHYCRTSIDVTMRGGTTSGVVYPLALCELARRFRFRNVGGASAGAIAASLAAAAELGRARWDRDERRTPDDLSDEAKRQGHVRQGFLGMADATAWFSQVDDGDKAKDEYRIAQLFRPTKAARSLFRLVVATMRSRWLGFGSLLLWSFGWRSRVITAFVMLAVPLLLMVPAPPPLSLPTYLMGALWLAVLTTMAAGTIAVLITIARRLTSRAKPREGPLSEPVASAPARKVGRGWLFGLLALCIGGSVAWVMVDRTDSWTQFGGWRIATVWFVLIIGLLTVCLGGVMYVLRHAKNLDFGLVSGSVGPASFRMTGLGTVWDRIAGLTPSTFELGLIPWLSRSMSQMAGLGDEVLRFGHLWLGESYRPPSGSAEHGPDHLESLVKASEDSISGWSIWSS